ncbi:axonemal dynein heavy chain beta [Naegleria gruberi]|uniref:Axonemal dynein heavy chain beta n=1 Tax=Naegleria gruberi TaxID=5762 RepID=D2V0F9_NAEGR|nr:axonemal dynein heavy chain beta [Naegleria gruberi]EFC49517.1 axonemal dynein heavy chain beta [Naegleria gruberi]|eukprot:XP_002682261.1 axonemal dynein heavy chain beta [Naegleria gruberi strain NEG-M]
MLFFIKSKEKEEIIVSAEPVIGGHKKGIVFLKHSPIKITTDNYVESLFYEDVFADPLLNLQRIVEGVYLPLLQSPKNQKGWPNVVAQDLIRQFHRFTGMLDLFIGHTRGSVVLPMPPVDETVETASQDRSLVHAFETSVIDWSKETRKVIELDSDKILDELEKEEKYQGPLFEIDFWQAKKTKLTDLAHQLSNDRVKMVISTLEKTQSSYVTGFKKMLDDLNFALDESETISKYFEPLRKYFQDLNDSTISVSDLGEVFKPILHLISLMWRKCEYFNTGHLYVLIREICNDIVTRIYNYIEPSELWTNPMKVVAEKLQISFNGCEEFKVLFFQYRDIVNRTNPQKTWKFESSKVFTRLNLFIERLHDLRTIALYIDDFLSLDKFDIGGVNGAELTGMMSQLFEEFVDQQQKIQNVSYDVLDLKEEQFERDFYKFCDAINDFDKRICFMINKALQLNTGFKFTFKLLESFESQARREKIRQEIEGKISNMLSVYSEEITKVSTIFNKNKENPPLLDNFPKVSGAIAWCYSLRERVTWPLEKFKEQPFLTTSSELQDIIQRHEKLMAQMKKYEDEIFNSWKEQLNVNSLSHLNDNIISRMPDKRLVVNFNPELSFCIQEVEHLKPYANAVPEEAIALFEKGDIYRAKVATMDLMVRQYNTVIQTLIDVEKPLLADRLTTVDNILVESTEKLTWQSDIDNFILQSRENVRDIYNRTNFLKGNVKTIEKMVESWMTISNLIITDNSGIEEMKEKKASKIFDMVGFWRQSTDSNPTFKVYSQWKSKVSANIKKLSDVIIQKEWNNYWRNYVLFVNSIIEKGVFNAVREGLTFLINSFSGKNDMIALNSKTLSNIFITVKLELYSNDAVFTPNLIESTNSVHNSVKIWVSRVIGLASMVKRLDEVTTFEKVIKDDENINGLRQKVFSLMGNTINDMNDLREKFCEFSHLWEEDPREYLARFIKSGGDDVRFNSDSEVSDGENEDDEEEQENVVASLEEFEMQILKYEKIVLEIADLPDKASFGWLIVDSSPIKTALSNLASKWRFTFLDHLLSDVRSTLHEFNSFVKELKEGLCQPIPKDDYPKLVEMMRYIVRFKERPEHKQKDGLFDNLRETVQLLKKCSIVVPQEIILDLDDAKNKWSDLSKVYFEVKDKLSVVQDEEIKKISKEEIVFANVSEKLREDFVKDAPFYYSIGVDAAYERIDEVHERILVVEENMRELRDRQKLFGLMQNQGKLVRESRAELRLLKRVWDLVALVQSQIDEWKSIPFLKINDEELTEETKKFITELKSVDKRVKRWEVFIGLQNYVDNFMITLPLIQKLRNPGMRSRHWKQLMEKSKVDFTVTEKFSLSDLLSLNLHKYQDDVNEIVDKSEKEMKMEKQLKDLDALWSDLKFDFTVHTNGVEIVKVSEEVRESLEDNQLQLQSSSSSRFVEFFIEEIEEWLRKLGKVDTVINGLLDVQRKWLYLENIFIGTDDIRQQLPNDAKNFDAVDRELKLILTEAKKVMNIVSFCSSPGLEEKIVVLQDSLTSCEHQLSKYLETKKKAFPRFYFTSESDLLDILSKGGQSPHKILKHMPKLIQAVKTLKFRVDDNGNQTNEVIAIVSREDEEVSLTHPCILQGKVEDYLNDLLKAISRTLRDILSEAMLTYSSANREEWLSGYASQVILVTSQIYWTLEVNQAFEALEENNEAAMKNYYKKQVNQLNKLISLVQNDLEKGERQKIMNLVTLDVHARDIVDMLINENITSAQDFGWQCQLRQRWDAEHQDCIIDICDATFKYGYEYLGNGPRLVITPLTDRIYITLTQSLHLIMGGAPAGPAGTGKTETTKDLGSQLGKSVYVFNCSDQMNNESLADIFKGLASSGAWGCFDEFNRIAVEVLSVVSTQFKSILNAIRAKKDKFMFEGEEITLDRTNGVFITMNPGYLGRTELPESLKALFRPVTVVVPDLELICENMLMAEGFKEAKVLAKKFITLYSLNKDLLSKQDHYDWGLRAIKSVLVVAGSLKRAEPSMPETHVLMRALRDFNLPKIVQDDLEVFTGLINDLFPGIDPPRKVDLDFEGIAAEEITALKLQPEDSLILKVVQLAELLEVRHSVFIIGPAGSGKSVCWKSLAAAKKRRNEKVLVRFLDPKAITSHELYGYKSEQADEWKDGLLSSIMKNLSEREDTDPKWIILDGDLDTEWIESMNSVMDDNRILTLANNDRIPLLSHMRLVFEISHLKYATPATVSRAGILYIGEKDIGWQPYVASWIDQRPQAERAHLLILVDKYIPETLRFVKANFKHLIPLTDFHLIHSLFQILESLFAKNPTQGEKEVMENFFAFATIFSFMGAISDTEKKTNKMLFDKWWRSTYKSIKFPDDLLVFDCYYNPKTKLMEPWREIMPNYEYDADIPVPQIMVPTEETTCIRYLMDHIVDIGKPLMLVANAGVGKTQLISDKLNNLDILNFASTSISFNYYTDSESLQKFLEGSLESKGGKRLGPPGNKKMIFFIDDFNMPRVDAYGTQTPIALLRQHLDYGCWYERAKWNLKEIIKVQYIASMNPTAGSFTVNPRLQRHFVTLGINFPSRASLQKIYGSILAGHLKRFPLELASVCNNVVNGTLDLHEKVVNLFPKTANKFHYEFNLRQLSSVFEGLLRSEVNEFKEPKLGNLKFARLLTHEINRVYGDRLSSKDDLIIFEKELKNIVNDKFPEFGGEAIISKPLVFSHFVSGGDGAYDQFTSTESVRKVLEEALKRHNLTKTNMDLVLFEDALEHVCRINRIIKGANGNALLVGVGGSGKQSLSRLAAFVGDFEVCKIVITKDYGVNNLKEDLKNMYKKAGKNQKLVFLLNDNQIVDEKFLVYINDLLSTGNIPDLFAADEKEEIANSLRTEVKSAGIFDISKESCWKFFINKVRRNLHVVLCFSPVGESLRIRSRNFPAIINCTQIDFFFPWPKEALLSVADKFLKPEMPITGEHHPSIVKAMAFTHEKVNEFSSRFLNELGRYTYTTPKSYLEFLKLYKSLLYKKRELIKGLIDRLSQGIQKLRDTTMNVTKLQKQLETQEKEVKEREIAADIILEKVKKERTVVEAENKKALTEEKFAQEINQQVAQQTAECEGEVEKAKPILEKAELALQTLNKTELTELRSFRTPNVNVLLVFQAVLILLSTKSGVTKDLSWSAAQKAMARGSDKFLAVLEAYDSKNIYPHILTAIQPFMDNPKFTGEEIRKHSSASGGLCEWVRNTIEYNKTFVAVKPMFDSLEKSKLEKAAAEEKLAKVRKTVAKLNKQLKKIEGDYQAAEDEKNAALDIAKKTQEKLDLAQRFVRALSSENARWLEEIQKLQTLNNVLIGDVLLASAFISYAGSFDMRFRTELTEAWKQEIIGELKIPTSENLNLLEVMTDDAEIAKWGNQKLPSDKTSIENGCILLNCERWPLVVDPQLQAITWIKNHYKDLIILRLEQPDIIEKMERAIQKGQTVLIENIKETIDAVLSPVIGRNIIQSGSSKLIKLGNNEIDYHENFKLILHTKLNNPHYNPEIQAETTLINFSVTEEGLEEQLLALVVQKERSDLEEKKSELNTKKNEFKIKLKELEDNLLENLKYKGDLLGNVELITGLENTKKTSEEIKIQVLESIETEKDINAARENYRKVAKRGAILYFLLDQLQLVEHMYKYSLAAFNVVFNRAITKTEKVENEDLFVRIGKLIDSITYACYEYTERGLFERHKLIFMTNLCFTIHRDIFKPEHLNFLINCPADPNTPKENPFADWLSESCFKAIYKLSQLEGFEKLYDDIYNSGKRWKQWSMLEAPEKEGLPQDWKKKTNFEKLLIIRALRPDRITQALKEFVGEIMGDKFVQSIPFSLDKIFAESRPNTPLFFILFPGADPIKNIEALGKRLGFSEENDKFVNISMGKGQEEHAEKTLRKSYEIGGWVVLQNIHLMQKWLPTLERTLEKLSEGSHKDFRVFLTAEPTLNPVIPQSILQNSIKITNEPPQDLSANLHRALSNFSQEFFESSIKQSEFKTILFALCFFHAVVLGRRKFGSQGWSRNYSFNNGDLTISADVLYNYLETNDAIPWEDIRYIFGEIMYGGHITDHWDRRTCTTYLKCLLKEQLFDETELAPGFNAPPSMNTLDEYHEFINEKLPAESPLLFGLHPNAEIDFLTNQSESLFKAIIKIRGESSNTFVSDHVEDTLALQIDELYNTLPENFDLDEISGKADKKIPFVAVCLQECERMNILLSEIKNSLTELKMGLNGELTMSEQMDKLKKSLSYDQVPARWEKVAYPSVKPLSLWFEDLIKRVRQLEEWSSELTLPKVLWLSGLFNPMAFLTAIMQTSARKNGFPLDRMCIQTEVLKKTRSEIQPVPPRDGCYVDGFILEGAGWDIKSNVLKDSDLKVLHSPMPVIHIKAVPIDKRDTKNIYECPVYVTPQRGPTYIFTAQLKTKHDVSKWVLAGACLLLQTYK